MKKTGRGKLIIIGSILSLGIISAVALSGKNQDIRNRAYFGAVTLGNIEDTNLKRTGSASFPMTVDSGKLKVSAVNLELEYDPAILDLNENDIKTVTLESVLKKSISDSNGKSKLNYIALTMANLPSGNFTVAEIQFKPKVKTGKTTLTYTAKEVSGINESGNDNSLSSSPAIFEAEISDGMITYIPKKDTSVSSPPVSAPETAPFKENRQNFLDRIISFIRKIFSGK